MQHYSFKRVWSRDERRNGLEKPCERELHREGEELIGLMKVREEGNSPELFGTERRTRFSSSLETY